MKILHVFTLAGTAEAFFDGQFKYLVNSGQEVHLICSPSDTILDFAKRNEVYYYSIEIPRTISPNEDGKALRSLCSLIRKNNFDIIVGHTPKGALLSMMAAKLCGCKKRVYLRHGLIYTTSKGIKRNILKMEEQFVSALASHIINVSPSVGELAIRDRLNSSKKQTVIGKGTCGGIDTEDVFNPEKIDKKYLEGLKATQKIAHEDYVIGFCGRLCKDKGIPELLEAFDLFRKRNPVVRTKLLLVGGYDGRDILSQKIHDKIEFDPDIIHVGHILKNLQYYYAMMDVFVFPSHREGFGMCSIEAQAMEIPALVAKSHGCIDTIEENVTGKYIGLTPEDICKELEFMNQPDKRKTMGEKAREFVVSNFDHSVLWPKIKEFYNSL